MNKLEFIISEFKYMLKNARLQFLAFTIMYVAFYLFPILAKLQLSLREIPEMPPDIVGKVIGALLKSMSPIVAPFIALMAAALVTQHVITEKNDKVFEQVFVAPFSQLDILIMRFISSALLAETMIIIIYFLLYIVTAFLTGYLEPFYILYVIALATLLMIPLTYILYLTTLFIPQKYFQIVLFLLIFAIVLFPGILVNYPTKPSGDVLYPSLETFSWALVATSIVIAIVGIVITLLVKKRISEMVITTS